MNAQRKYDGCIEACSACSLACNFCASSCLREPDVQMMAKCVALDIDCAQMCALASALMARDSAHAKALCAVCADACQACGEECGKHHHMAHCQACAEACRACAAACRQMASTA